VADGLGILGVWTRRRQISVNATNVTCVPNLPKSWLSSECHGAVVLHLATLSVTEDHSIRSKGRFHGLQLHP
jgi:hypothetical protein